MDDHVEFVDVFCRQLRSQPAYRDALLVVTIEANNNQTVALLLSNAFDRFAPVYKVRRVDVEDPRGEIIMSAQDEAKKTMLTENAGILTGIGVMSKVHYVYQLLLVMQEGKLTRAPTLIGHDAEKAWDILIKEMTYFSTVLDVSAKKRDFVPDKIELSGKSGAAKGDDALMALLINTTVIYVHKANRGSQLNQFCIKEHFDMTSPSRVVLASS